MHVLSGGEREGRGRGPFFYKAADSDLKQKRARSSHVHHLLTLTSARSPSSRAPTSCFGTLSSVDPLRHRSRLSHSPHRRHFFLSVSPRSPVLARTHTRSGVGRACSSTASRGRRRDLASRARLGVMLRTSLPHLIDRDETSKSVRALPRVPCGRGWCLARNIHFLYLPVALV